MAVVYWVPIAGGDDCHVDKKNKNREDQERSRMEWACEEHLRVLQGGVNPWQHPRPQGETVWGQRSHRFLWKDFLCSTNGVEILSRAAALAPSAERPSPREPSLNHWKQLSPKWMWYSQLGARSRGKVQLVRPSLPLPCEGRWERGRMCNWEQEWVEKETLECAEMLRGVDRNVHIESQEWVWSHVRGTSQWNWHKL